MTGTKCGAACVAGGYAYESNTLYTDKEHKFVAYNKIIYIYKKMCL